MRTSSFISRRGPASRGSLTIRIEDFHANVMPIRHLLAACARRAPRPIVVFAGTVTEAGIPSRLPVNEDEPDNPITAYDRHKLIAENDLKAAAAQGVVRGATLRLSNVYGPGRDGKPHDRDVLNRMIRAALAAEPLTVYGSGEYMRDYVFVEDVVDAFLRAACTTRNRSTAGTSWSAAGGA